MKRFASQSHKEERTKISERLRKSPPSTIIETDEATITKLLSGKVYTNEDMKKCAKNLLPKYNHSYEMQCQIFENVQDFDIAINSDRPVFGIFGKPKSRWVLFCILGKYVLYKDPCGDIVPFNLVQKLKENVADVIFVAHREKSQHREDVKSYGPLTVRNLKILLEFLSNEGSRNFIEEFPKMKFAQLESLKSEKFSKVVSLVNEVSTNEDFKIALKNFVDKLPLDLGSAMLEYKDVLEKELEKGEEEANLDRIRAAREKYLNQENVKEFQNNYKLNEKQLDKDKIEWELDIQQKFPKEMKKLTDIFELLDDIKIDKELYAALQTISEILTIDYKKMKSFYSFKARIQSQKNDIKLTPGDINKIVTVSQKVTPSDDCTPLKQLLVDIVLGIDQDPPRQINHEICLLEERYHTVKTSYEKWRSSDIKTINSWAKQAKGHLGDDIYETVAIMDRALNLLTGYRLRDTQILAVLIFFYDNTGRLCQIKTGEGKTVIVSLLAVIKALQGYTVDVITSNPILASDGVAETRDFYSVFGLTVGTNNPQDSKIGYTADILYGTISNFQFDYLKDSFEGFNIRGERKFGQVILDEVDSMLVDNGGHIAKLASPYPGMESLRYIYIKIWEELHKAEESFAQELREKLMQDKKLPLEDILNERRIIKEKIKAANPTDIPLIPAHLKEYVSVKLDTWIKNALHAKHNCHEHQQYRIVTNDSGERVVAPVDYLNTGVTMRNTIWSNGLHQFIQLKHNLHLTFESLTSSFISNIGYIKNYDNKRIFGLTGTLGSRAEQELLSHIYKVDYAKLPTYKKKKFEEIPGLISDDESWARTLTIEILEKIDEGRAVLAIFETERDLLTVKKNLEILKENFRVRMYANEDHAAEIEERVKIGDIILATNIAGRGTNFKTEKDLESKGGLHICVGFLPCNLRVEGQAFGRTSRQGNKGTAQLIIRQSEVEELGLGDKATFEEIKEERDNLERKRLEHINANLVKELNFKDELFGCFSDFHRSLKQDKLTRSYMFVLQDLKEFWAFWLEKKNFQAKNIITTSPQTEFQAFLNEAQAIIGGKISHNPYYCIALADHYLEKGYTWHKAASILDDALRMGGSTNYELLAGAHLKYFELAVANGGQVMERCKKAIAKVFFVDVQKNEEYKTEAITHLGKAKLAINKEITYIEKYLTSTDPAFRKILSTNRDNLLLKHIHSRFYSLKIHEGNINQLLETLRTVSGGVDFNGTAFTTVENFNKITTNSQMITNSELCELQAVGINTIYSLREIHDVPNAVIYTAQGQILAGIAALVVGLCFLPVFPIMSSIAGTLISEGIMDIVMEVMTQGSSEFDDKEFMKGKFISYGISLITFGIGAITQSVKILTKAVNFCRKLSSFLRESTYLKSLCSKLATLIDRLGDILEKMLVTAKFNKLSKSRQLEELSKLKESGNLEKFEHLGGLDKLKELEELQRFGELRRSELLVNFVEDVTESTAKEIGKSIAQEIVIKPLLSSIFGDLIERIKESFKNCLRQSITSNDALLNKLCTTSSGKINNVVDAFTSSDEVQATAKDVGFKLLGLCNSTVVDALTLTYDSIKGIADFTIYGTKFASYLDQELEGGESDNDVDAIIEEICSKLAGKMFGLWCEIFKCQLTGLKMSLEMHLDSQLTKTEVGNALSTSEEKKLYRKMALQVHSFDVYDEQ